MAVGGFARVVRNGKEVLEPLAPGMQTERHLMQQADCLRFWSALALALISVACLVSACPSLAKPSLLRSLGGLSALLPIKIWYRCLRCIDPAEL